MARRQAFMEKIVESGTSLELEAKSGEAFLIHDIMVLQASIASTFMTVSVDLDDIRYLSIRKGFRNHCAGLHRDDNFPSLMAYLSQRGFNTSIPIAEGQKLTITGFVSGDVVKVVYSIWDPEDISKDMPNGTEGKEFIFVSYGANPSDLAIQPSGYIGLTQTRNPAKFPQFPFAGQVPANTKIELLAIGSVSFTKAVAGPINTYTSHLRFTKEREVLFDKDKAGFINRGDAAAVADSNTATVSQIPWHTGQEARPLLVLPEPVIFNSGESLLVEMNFGWTGAGQVIPTGNLNVFIVERFTVLS